MISVKKLTKIYTGHDKKMVIALKNVSFKLPDKGLIFITGKSGSGKSTLLNMLGGLDNVTRGDIIADGNKFSDFTVEDYDKYRNSYIGFIFQDYCLLEDLTIYQNIELVLDLNQKHNKSVIRSILDKVHLSSVENRYPRELSGGQKQRVAIARALAKDPQLFLADEPTGNLDSKTAKQIMEILKELSKTKLVVVVSHNLEDAEFYGDRIIELADGEIVRDEEKMQGFDDKLELINGKLILPRHKELTPEEIEKINIWQKNNEISEVCQRHDGFYPSSNNITSENKVVTQKSKLSFKNSAKLAKTFLKNRKLSFFITTIIITCIMSILGLCQFFVQFDYNKAINDSVVQEGQTTIVGFKSSYLNEDYNIFNTSFIFDIEDEDIEAIKNSDYNSDFYVLYNNSLFIAGASQLLRQEIKLNSQSNLGNFFALESYGTLVCNEEYIKNKFNLDKVVYVGNPMDKPYGIIITDYIADSIIYYSNGKINSYQDLIGLFYENSTDYSNYINAVLVTGYKDEYALFKEKLMNEYQNKVLQQKTTKIYSSDEFKSFSSYVEKFLGVSYSYNSNYFSDCMSLDVKNYCRIDYSTINSNILSEPSETSSLIGYVDSNNNYYHKNLSGNNIAMSTTTYNHIFNTDYNSSNLSDYSGNTVITLNKFSRIRNDNNSPKISKELKIVELFDADINAIVLDSQFFYDFRSVENFDYAIYFDDVSNISGIYNVAIERQINVSSNAFNSVSRVIDVIDVFEGFFNIITFGLLLTCLLLLINFGAGSIRKRKFEIGVIKAMGGQTQEVGKIFILQLLSVGLLVCLLSSISLFVLSNFVNEILSDAMLFFLKNETLGSLSLIQFNQIVLVCDLCMILGITFVSAIIPLQKLHKIKPINIIKHTN